ncbi:hypothetical protein Pyn_15383 [Prunus yedoensis var. nudiflora]|uniref:Uncharacterized protein n=1 Tax=Prunus yedoensis var. nudiflora TaxID=2094558 RepID=A0A314YQE4_PRUYE|nr:hypothetical protein Pyn_15383 [Prunus yedoensis var. nudiflora]
MNIYCANLIGLIFATLRGFRKVANAVVTSLEKHSCPEADTYGTIVRVGKSIRRDFVIINLVAKLSNSIPAWRLDESVQQFAEVEEAFDFWGTPEGDPVHPAELDMYSVII